MATSRAAPGSSSRRIRVPRWARPRFPLAGLRSGMESEPAVSFSTHPHPFPVFFFPLNPTASSLFEPLFLFQFHAPAESSLNTPYADTSASTKANASTTTFRSRPAPRRGRCPRRSRPACPPRDRRHNRKRRPRHRSLPRRRRRQR